MKHLPFSVLVVLVATTGVACGSTKDAPELESSEAQIVAKVLANTAKVYSDRLVFPKAAFTQDLRRRVDRFNAAIEAGERKRDVENVILVGDRQQNATSATGMVREDVGNPYGYIRRALTYRDDGSQTIVMTEVASLEEAFSELEENGIVEIGTSHTAAEQKIVPNFGVRKKLSYSIPIIDVSGKELYREGDSVVRIKSGFVTLNTNIDLGVKIGFFSLKHAHAIVDASVDSELVMEAASSVAFGSSVKDDVFTGRWPIGSIGPIPVTLGLTTTVGCDVTAKADVIVSAGVHAAVGLRGGVKYNKGHGVEPVIEAPTFDARIMAPTVTAGAEASVRCYLKPQLQLYLFDVVGPTITPVLSGKLAASVPPFRASFKGGVSASVGGKLSVFGKDLGSVNQELFSVEKTLWSTGAP